MRFITSLVALSITLFSVSCIKRNFSDGSNVSSKNDTPSSEYGLSTVVSPGTPPKPPVTLNSCEDFFNKNDTILKFSMPEEGEGIFKINKSTKPLKATYYIRNKNNEKNYIKTLHGEFHDKLNRWVFRDQFQSIYFDIGCSQSKMSGIIYTSTAIKHEFEINNEKKTTKCSNFFDDEYKYSPMRFNSGNFFRYTTNSDEKYYGILKIDDTNSDSVYNAHIKLDNSSTPVTITLNDDKITFKDKSGKNETWEGTCYESVILGLKNNQDFAISITNL